MLAAARTGNDLLYWLALRMVPGLGSRRAVPLVQQYGSPEAVFRASRTELIEAGLPPSVAQTISSGCTFEEAAEQHRLIDKFGVRLLGFLEPEYPALLKEISDPPLVLYTRGNIELLQGISLAVVGTRRATPYGTAATERLVSELASCGLVITSGMARGIDTAAHRAALSVGGGTIAVFGSGIDHIYPAENRRLADEIVAKGLLVSEFPMGNPGHPQNFPVRNRVISGLSVGVLVVEGAQYSGSAITARMAMEQNREIFAVPGSIVSKMSWAPNLLIKQGAKLVQAAEDVLTELPAHLRQRLNIAPVQNELPGGETLQAWLTRNLGPASSLAAGILALLEVETPTHVDVLLEKLDNWSSSEIIATLFQLQLLGVVRELAGKNFVKVWIEGLHPAANPRDKFKDSS